MDVIADNLDSYLGGIAVTLWLSALSFLLAVVIGVTVAAFRVSPLRLLRTLRLVRARRAGRMVFYALDDRHIVTLFKQGLRHVEEADAARRPRRRLA